MDLTSSTRAAITFIFRGLFICNVCKFLICFCHVSNISCFVYRHFSRQRPNAFFYFFRPENDRPSGLRWFFHGANALLWRCVADPRPLFRKAIRQSAKWFDINFPTNKYSGRHDGGGEIFENNMNFFLEQSNWKIKNCLFWVGGVIIMIGIASSCA